MASNSGNGLSSGFPEQDDTSGETPAQPLTQLEPAEEEGDWVEEPDLVYSKLPLLSPKLFPFLHSMFPNTQAAFLVEINQALPFYDWVGQF